MEKNVNVMRLLFEVHKQRPQLRLAQLICVAAANAQWQNDDVFYLPDERLAEGLEKMLQRM